MIIAPPLLKCVKADFCKKNNQKMKKIIKKRGVFKKNKN
jgi:hypothetical protein